MDDQVYDWYPEVKGFKGLKFTNSWNKDRPDVIKAKNLGPLGISDSIQNGLNHGGNAGYFALNLAHVMGGNPIYLLGIDMKYKGDETHFHDGYPNLDQDVIKEKRFAHMINSFTYGLGILKERGVQVYNCSNYNRNREG
jgi:hypothetical protein